MSQSASPVIAPQDSAHPVDDQVRQALAVCLRGCEELLPEADWVKKLARSQATKAKVVNDEMLKGTQSLKQEMQRTTGEQQ